MSYGFEWDEAKARSNQIEHEIGFDEATTVFNDPLAKIFDDDLHSVDERREIIIGHSANNRLLLVCFTERSGEIIRIISARLANARERQDYEENARI